MCSDQSKRPQKKLVRHKNKQIMQKAITIFTIGALVSFETTAVSLEAEAEVEAEVGRISQSQKAAWRAYWQD